VTRLRWGLAVAAAGAGARRPPVINARSESAFRSPLFREAMRSRRLVVPAAGFYEWGGIGRERQPHAIRSTSGLVGLAGIWEPSGTFAVLTRAANEAVAPIHDRMPIILERAQFAAWLDVAGPSELDVLLRAYPSDRIVTHPVGTRVNRPQVDDPQCLAPAERFLPPPRLF
jgi:putative SOS response-associated peptidase YedK